MFAGLIAALALAACSSMQVAQVDPTTGRLQAAGKATVVLNKPFKLDERKALVLVPNGEFAAGQIKALNYFDDVITATDLENRIIQANLSDKVVSVRDRLGLNNAAKQYKPFMWLRFTERGSRPMSYVQMTLTDPLTMEDVFTAEIALDYVWTGVNDQYTWYPLFNALIDYISANSQTYAVPKPVQKAAS